MNEWTGTETEIPAVPKHTKPFNAKQRSLSHGRRTSSSGPRPPRLSHAHRQHAAGAASSNDIPLRNLAEVTSPTAARTASSYTLKTHRPPLGGGDEDEASVLADVELVDILGTNFSPDPDDFSKSVVNITAEISPLSESTSFDRSLYWIHHERTTSPAKFEDFQEVLSRTPGLYDHEAAVASKCLGEVKMQRKVFANGRYLGSIYHEATTAHQPAVQNIVAKATFLSIPIFTRMSPGIDESPTNGGFLRRPFQKLFDHLVEYFKDEHDRNHHQYLTSKVLRSQTTHPIRSLMQYSNILALDHRRDYCQAMLQLQEFGSFQQPFVHVPELWVLIINECTIITSGPFSLNDLCGSNMRLRKPLHPHDQRMILRYFNLQGVLHNFRCRTWLGLLDIIDRIESDIDDLRACLDEPSPTSAYALLDSKFRAMNRSRWNRRTSDDNPTRFVTLRLVSVSPHAKLNVRYSERKLREDVRFTWASFGLIAKLKQAERDVKYSRTSLNRQGTERTLKMQIADLNKKLQKSRRDRISNRFRLFAVRYKLLDPDAQMWGEDQRYFESRTNLSLISPEKLQKYQMMLETSISDIMGDQSDEPVSATESQVVAEALAGVDVMVGTLETLGSLNPLSRKVTFVDGPNVRFQPSDYTADPDLDLAEKVARFERDVGRTAGDGLAEARDQFLPPKRRFTSHVSVSPGEKDPQRLLRPKTYHDLEAQMGTHHKKHLMTFSRRATQPAPRRSNSSRDAQVPSLGVTRTRSGSNPGSASSSLRRPGIYKERFSPTSSPAITKVILPADPQRVPILSKLRELSSNQSQGKTLALKSRHKQNNPALPDLPDAPRPSTAENQTTNIKSMASDQLRQKRSHDKFCHVLPFFEWQRPADYPPITPRESHQHQGLGESSPFNHARSHSLPRIDIELRRPEHEDICATLTEINDMLGGETQPRNEDLLIDARQYKDVEAVSHMDVMSSLDQEYHELVLKSPGANAESHASERKALWTAKMRLVLAVDTLLRRFVGVDYFKEHLILKVWGIVSRLTKTTLDEVGPTFTVYCSILTPSVLQIHEINRRQNTTRPITAIFLEIDHIEHEVRDVLLSVRSNNATDLEQIEVLLPRRFLYLFRDLLVLLLSKTLALKDPLYDPNTVKLSRIAVDDSLRESANALLRATERLSLPFDVGFESIRSADTLLGLIVENALNISCSDVDQPTNEGYDPHFDLEFTYRLYASECLRRAKREASARVYEEVRLLDEEIDTIVKVLQDQKHVFNQMQEHRESAKQTLDIWVDQRIGDHLDEMITHFQTLHDYAEQAHEWTSNSIRVRGEDNSKAIYVFTFFTVVFLPLTFVVSTRLPDITSFFNLPSYPFPNVIYTQV